MSSSITSTLVDLMDSAQLKSEYMIINPNHAVPSYREVDKNGNIFLLSQSSCILKYLAHRYDSPYYPKELQARARVNMVLSLPYHDVYQAYHYMIYNI